MEKTARLAKHKPFFIGLSCLSITCLFSGFGYPLQSLEVWQQSESNQFNQPYDHYYIITDTDNHPYGFNPRKAQKVSFIYQDYKFQKLLLLGSSVILAGIAMLFGDETIQSAEIDNEIQTMERTGNKEFLLSKVKHKWAMLSEAQKQLFREEIKALSEMAGGDVTAEATEINETDKFINANYLLQEGKDIDNVVAETWNVKKDSDQHSHLKRKFEAWLAD